MKILCIGRNYVAHAQELGNEVPTEPVVFMKPDSALIENTSSILYPNFTNDLHYEIEIVLKVSKKGNFITKTDAPNYIDAFTLGIDFTARDKQDELKKKGLPWEKAKGFDQSALIGKWQKTEADFFTKKHEFTLQKNQEIVQSGNTELMLFNFATIIEEISKYFTLYPNDLIFTGTPAGVGACIKGDTLQGNYFTENLFTVAIH